MKKIIIAPDSFKGTLSASEVCEIIEIAARKYLPDVYIKKMTIADGGEGLVDAMLYACLGQKIWTKVNDPLMREIDAAYGVLPDGTAVIEMAAASGLPLLAKEERNVLKTSTHGTGQLILDALNRGCREFILGLGGSATNDGGAGLAAALGIKYCDSNGSEILNGDGLGKINYIDTRLMTPKLKEAHFTIACDVKNPLYGPNGAAHIFGPQKGASPQQVEQLDAGLKSLAHVIERLTGTDLQSIPGTGPAGGTAAPLIAFADSQLCKGLDVVLQALNFDRELENCDLVVTGEGRTDAQTLMGKVIDGVARHAQAKGVPVVVISGSLQAGYQPLYQNGVTAAFSTCRQTSSLEEALEMAHENLEAAAEDVFRLIAAFEK